MLDIENFSLSNTESIVKVQKKKNNTESIVNILQNCNNNLCHIFLKLASIRKSNVGTLSAGRIFLDSLSKKFLMTFLVNIFVLFWF